MGGPAAAGLSVADLGRFLLGFRVNLITIGTLWTLRAVRLESGMLAALKFSLGD